MPVRYRKELAELDGVYRATREMDVAPLCAIVERWSDRPMMMVGSGGSFSAATFAADLHESTTGYLARAATPLDMLSKVNQDSGLVCFSARGRNRDIITAFRAAATRELDPLSALVLDEHPPLEKLGKKYGYSDVVCMEHRLFKDGFLAVASLVAFSMLLIRAYRSVFGRSEEDLPEGLVELIQQVTSFAGLEDIHVEANRVMHGRGYMSVVYSPELAATAVDLESRFVEAALGALHVADLRNFGHGRHFWMARKGWETGVLALISEEQVDLGTQTVALLPDDVKTLPIFFRGSSDLQAVAGLVVGLFLTEAAAKFVDVDPGKPGVPPFGRRLYHLKPKLERTRQAELNRAASLRRKGAHPDDPLWIARYQLALDTVNSSRYAALVVDYDGTLCDSRNRTEPLSAIITAEIMRLMDEGAILGLATGRGPSAAIELRASLSPRLHDKVLVGYYNGAIIRRLTDRDDPLLESPYEESILTTVLADDPMLSGRVRSNPVQISIGVRRGTRIEAGAAQVRMLMHGCGVEGEVVTSGHSIDVCLAGQSKENLVQAIRVSYGLGEGPILRIGDRGRPPGNDWRLLDDPHGLSVDEVSGHPKHCWSFTPAGTKGVQATSHYLRHLRWSGSSGGCLRLSQASKP